jgi:hypothetical protein
MKLDPQDIRRLARFTLESKPADLSCDDWLHMVGEFVEAERSGAGLNERHQLVARHVEACGACAQELEALRELLDG